MLLVEFDYTMEPKPSIPLIDTTKERNDMWLLKKDGLPPLLGPDPQGSVLTDRMTRSLTPDEVARGVADGTLRLLDLRTALERRLTLAPPGASPASVTRHLLRPDGPGTVYLCAHAVRSNVMLRRGAVEVAGSFRRWRADRLPVVRRAQ